MRFLHRALPAGGLGFVVSLLLAACGGNAGLLTGQQASDLNNRLNQVSSALAGRDCPGVQNAVQGLAGAVGNLPQSVNSTLRQNLDQGASTVGQLATKQCQRPPAPTTTSTTTSSTSTPTTTQTTMTSTITSSATSATTTTTTGTSSTQPNGGAGLSGGGGGGGSGGGSGGGGGGSAGGGSAGGTSGGGGPAGDAGSGGR